MPLYEYRCTACNRLTEKRQKFSDPEITDCPHCGGKLERTITAPAVQFKGGGWYADGYGSKKPAAASSESSGASSETKGGEGAKAASGSDSSASATPAAPAAAAASKPVAPSSSAGK